MNVRWIALPLLVGMAAVLVFTTSKDGWRTRVWTWPGQSDSTATEPKVAHEDWLICTTMPDMGEADWAQLDPDFAAGKKALAREDWTGAIAALEVAAVRDPYNADIQNYIGYAYRRLRQFGPAMQHYQEALVLNRRHRSAHAHVGELYLILGDGIKAEQQLAMLEDICLIPCAETEDLKRAITTYKTTAAR
jgi:tetratricopeptide (TPR) repeat protein